MSITSIDDYLGAARQIIDYTKTVSKATSGGNASTYFEIAGSPGAGTLAASSTTGVVPVDTDVGYPKITNFAGGATGYLSRFSAFGSVRATSMPHRARWARVVQTFWPLTIHSSPSRTADEARPATSDPAPGSEKSWHQTSSPVNNGRR